MLFRSQIQRADDTDLYVFLSGRGEQFKRCGKEYRWLRHDSVMINKNEWYRFSQNKGGHAIDFMNANFPCFSYSNQKQEPKRPFFCRGSCNFIIISILKMQ